METVTKYTEATLPRIEREKALSVVSITVATALLYSSYRLISSSRIKQGFKEIPEPDSSYPYVGHMFSLGKTPDDTVDKWHKELGPIFKLRMGRRTWVLINDPELAHKVFVTHGAETAYRPNTMFSYYYHSMEGKGIGFSEPGPMFRRNRSAALTVLAPNLITEKYMDSIHKESLDLVDRLITSTEAKGAVNPFKYLELNSLNVIFCACFGRKFKSIDDPEFVDLASMIVEGMAMSDIQNDLANFLPIAHVFDYFAGTQVKMRRFIDTRRDPVFKKLIKEAANCEGPNVVKSLLENGVDFDDDETLVFMADLVFAGTDTVSVTLTWICAIMCNHPETQALVCAEIDDFIQTNGRTPRFTDRDQLPFCISVMKECMRYKPISSFGLPRSIKKDLEIDGYIIPKNSTIALSMVSMHKQSSIYPAPEKFIPERFMGNQKTMQSSANGKLSERDHFNFGYGRRICPGAYLAELEIFSSFVQLFTECTIKPAVEMPDIKNVKPGGLTLNPLPYKVKFVKR